MPISPEFVRYSVGAIRRNHPIVGTLLDQAYGDVSTYSDGSDGSLTTLDLAVDKTRVVLSKLSGATIPDVERVLGREASSALDDVRSAIIEATEAFGLTAGPDRTPEQEADTAQAVAALLYWARERFGDWNRATAHVPIPGMTDRPPSVGEFSSPEKPTRTVPVVPPRISGETAARRVRTALGTAFSMAALSYGRMANIKPEDRGNVGNYAVSDFASIEAELCVLRDGLGRRASAEDEQFVEMAGIAADEASRFYDLATAKLSNPSVGSYDFVVAEARHTATAFGRVVKLADKLIRERGYDFSPALEETASPAP